MCNAWPEYERGERGTQPHSLCKYCRLYWASVQSSRLAWGDAVIQLLDRLLCVVLLGVAVQHPLIWRLNGLGRRMSTFNLFVPASPAEIP